MTPDQLASALDFDEQTSQRTRLLVASLTLVADISIPRQERLGALDYTFNRTTPETHA